MTQPIKIQGLAEFTRNLRKIDNDLPKAVRLAGNEAVEIVLTWARPRVPHRSGAAVRSLKARSTRTAARAQAGGDRARYFPWLDFGGATGPRRSVKRPFIRQGRYLWRGLAENHDKVRASMASSLVRIVEQAGIEVT